MRKREGSYNLPVKFRRKLPGFPAEKKTVRARRRVNIRVIFCGQ